ncbi:MULTISPECIES: pyridoxamine 5'-phosphate oxidase family protein [Aminobacterium]|jgi:hypothetical protein|uniref:pyridoxamine 5'-phosphate oxidase family protein n=3 Tax=Aminobacteriaceae TaxID=3029087 RepID=UPI00257F2248|nr:pyridoxamine 5'-phosphate oxidase family protein [Aminobacterium sp. UBA4908]
MFKEMRRKDRELSNKEALALLELGNYMVFSTLSQDGYSYGVPLHYVFINNTIYFHCAMEGHKLENVAHNDKVSICVIGKVEVVPEKFATNYESVIAFGRAKEILGEEKEWALSALIAKYSPEHISEGREYIKRASDKTKVIGITLERITGKARRG